MECAPPSPKPSPARRKPGGGLQPDQLTKPHIIQMYCTPAHNKAHSDAFGALTKSAFRKEEAKPNSLIPQTASMAELAGALADFGRQRKLLQRQERVSRVRAIDSMTAGCSPAGGAPHVSTITTSSSGGMGGGRGNGGGEEHQLDARRMWRLVHSPNPSPQTLNPKP